MNTTNIETDDMADSMIAHWLLLIFYIVYILTVTIYFSFKLVRRTKGYISEREILLSEVRLFNVFKDRGIDGVPIRCRDRFCCVGAFAFCSDDADFLPLRVFVLWYITHLAIVTGACLTLYFVMTPTDPDLMDQN